MKPDWYILPEFYVARASRRATRPEGAEEGRRQEGEGLTSGAWLRARLAARGSKQDTSE